MRFVYKLQKKDYFTNDADNITPDVIDNNPEKVVSELKDRNS